MHTIDVARLGEDTETTCTECVPHDRRRHFVTRISMVKKHVQIPKYWLHTTLSTTVELRRKGTELLKVIFNSTVRTTVCGT